MALNLREFLRPFLTARSLEELIPLDTFINDETIFTRTGSAVTTFAVEAADDECMSLEDRLHLTNRLIAASNLLDSSNRHYQYVFKTRRYALPGNNPPGTPISPEASTIMRHRSEHLRQQALGGTIEIYHALESLLPFTAPQLAPMDAEKRRQEYRRLLSEIDTLARGFAISLDDTIAPIRLDKESVFGVFHRFLHLGEDWSASPRLKSDSGLARQLRDASVYWDNRADCLRVGCRCVRVFTLQDLPEETVPNLFGELLSIDTNLVVVTCWQPLDRLAARDELSTLRTLVINFERLRVGDRAAMRRDPTLREELRNAGVTDDLMELNEVLGQLRRKRHVGKYSLTILLHGERKADLDSPVAEMEKIFRLASARLHEEVGGQVLGNAIPVYFDCLPGNRWDLRAMKLRNDHYAELTWFWAPDTGDRKPERGEWANVYETRGGPLHFQSIHYNLVAAETVLGMTRSGKTLYQQDRIAALQAKGPITRIYDVGGSYETLAAYFGGSVLRCSIGEWKEKVNPFLGNTRSRNFQEFCFQFVKSLAESDGYRMTPEDHLQLYKKIDGLFELRSTLRRLKTLRSVLEGPLKEALTKWVEGGQYGALFDHADDDLVIADFQVFEFEQVEDGVPAPYLEPLQTLLIYRDTRTVLDPANRTRLKHFTFDECVAHWRRPQMAELVKRILKTFQKKNGMISLVTQSPEDMGILEPFILQSCSSYAFFPSPKIEDEVLKTKFQFDEARIGVFRSLRPREFLYHALRGDRDDLWKVLKLTVDPYRYWMFTTSPLDVAKREAAIEKHGMLNAIQKLAAGGAA